MNPTPFELQALQARLERNRNPRAAAAKQEAQREAVEAGEEIKLQGEIAQYLRLRGIEYIKPDHRKKSPLPPGWPDFTFAYCGFPCAWEIKTATGSMSADQIALHPKLKANGWDVCVVRSIQQAKSILDLIEKSASEPSDLNP